MSWGLIPACAGKTRRSETGTAPVRAHPRVCGENFRTPMPAEIWPGSSPRVRGKPTGRSDAIVSHGLIPACAGKTHQWSGRESATRAHPRVCGENLSSLSGKARCLGSSPRVRGKLTLGSNQDLATGLIPACAGKTSSMTCVRGTGRAHPRVCGENAELGFKKVGGSGSSPRVRGKPPGRIDRR